MKDIYHTLEDGRIIEIRNWMGRQQKDAVAEQKDAIIARTLSDSEKCRYVFLKGLGYTDRDIFIFLNRDFLNQITKKEVNVPLEILSKDQIVMLINRKMRLALPSLKKLDKKDLVKLFIKLNDW